MTYNANLKLPAKVLEVQVTSKTGYAFWDHDDGTGDPWWRFGPSPRDYQWTIQATVTTQTHSSHLTRSPFEYTGLDINVGDYIVHNTSGLALRVVSILQKSDLTITFIGEDTARYNTFRAPGETGNGIFSLGTATVFSVSLEGQPVIDPVTTAGISPYFTLNLLSRFQNFGNQYNLNLTQVGHTFEVGDIIAINTAGNNFVLADTSSHNKLIGRITSLGPSPDDFYLTAVQKVLDNLNFLPGDVGDIMYLDSSDPGNVTTTLSNTEVYIKLRNHTQSQLVGSISNPSTTVGNQFQINGITVTITGTGTLADCISDINVVHASSGVLASSTPASSIAISNQSQLFYGEPSLFANTPATASINGVTVTFDLFANGFIIYAQNIAITQDLADAINRDMLGASITTIIASVSISGNLLEITNTTGGSITIINLSTDDNGKNFAGNASGSGIPLVTSAVSGSYITLIADDARGIILNDIVGIPTIDLGIFSIENGLKAIAIFSENSSSSSAASINFIHANVNFAGATTQAIGTIPANSIVISVQFQVSNISNTSTLISLGDASSGISAYMATTENDTQIQGLYFTNCNVVINSLVTANATLTNVGTQGNASVTIGYITPP